jgi:hypothetical protein
MNRQELLGSAAIGPTVSVAGLRTLLQHKLADHGITANDKLPNDRS